MDKIEIDYDQYREDIRKEINEITNEIAKVDKKISKFNEKLRDESTKLKDLYDRLANVYRNVNLYWYDPNNEVTDISGETILKYNVIRVIFNKTTKQITQWEGYDNISEAAYMCKVAETTVKNYLNGTYKIPYWATYTFMSAHDFYNVYYKADIHYIETEDSEEDFYRNTND